MSEKKECLVCGKLFTPCDSCKNLAIFFEDEMYQWRRVVCCLDHFYHHIPIIEYVRGKRNKDSAKTALLDAIERYGEVKYKENIQPIVDEILDINITPVSITKNTKTK